MRSQLSSTDARSRWQRRWPFLVLLILAPIALYLLLRPKGGEEKTDKMGPNAVTQKPRYENRGLWRRPEGGGPAKVSGIRGNVYDGAGNPLADVQVTATTFQLAGNQNHVAGHAKTDVNGRFQLPLSDGSYYLNADKEGYGSTLALAHGGDEVGLVLLESGLLEGRITNERGDPVTKFTIDVIGPSTEDMAAPAPFVTKRFESVDGTYRITQLPDRPMYLRAMADGYAPAFSDPIKSNPGQSQKVDLTLTAGCVLTGVVEDANGRPLAEALVDAELRKSAGVIGDTSIDAASKDVTDTDGKFRLANVPLGNILLRAYEADHAPTATAMELGSCADLAPLRVVMSAGATLTGIVRDADEKPVAGAKVVLMNRAIGFANTVSDSEGRYRYDKLPPGVMRIEAHRGIQRAVAQFGIEEGTPKEQDLVFAAKGSGVIRGRVMANKKPLPGMQMLIATSTGGGLMNMHFPVTDEEGIYRVSGLPEGIYGILIASMNQVSSARLEEGATETVNFDVAKRPVPPPRPDVEMESEEQP